MFSNIFKLNLKFNHIDIMDINMLFYYNNSIYPNLIYVKYINPNNVYNIL